MKGEWVSVIREGRLCVGVGRRAKLQSCKPKFKQRLARIINTMKIEYSGPPTLSSRQRWKVGKTGDIVTPW